MKRLGVYAFIAIGLISAISGFTLPEKSYAQTTKVQLESKANTVFSNFIAQLEAKQSNPKQIPSLANASDADIAKYIQGNKELVAIITTGKSTFNQLFSTPAATSTNVYANFTAALNAAASKINEGQANSSLVRSNSILRAEVTTISSQINTLAQERQQELINSGKAEEAGVIQNAVGEQRKEQAKQELSAGKCTSLFNASIVDCIDAGFAWLIKNTLLRFAGFLLFITASMLNYAVQLSILDFAKWAPDTLYPIWVIVRQIVSLAVVFAGLYLGFMYIMGDETKFGKYVGWLVIFALFVNFSYPFSRALVDVSNIVSLNVYTAALGPETLAGKGGAGDIIRDKLGVQTMISGIGQKEGGKDDEQKINNVPGSLLAVAFVLYAAFIFFMATAIITVRAAVLVFLIIASPLLLVDSVIPKLGDAAAKMRKLFFEQLIVAPVFMIMLALTLKFMDVFTSAAGTRTDSVAVFFNMLMMLVMLHIMLKVTKSVSGQAGEFATGMMGKVGGFGLGVATGGAGLLARGSIGAAAARMRDSDWMKNNQDSRLGRGMHGLTNSLAQSTFDTRNIGMVKTGMAKAGLTGIGGMGMGQGSKNSYDDDFKIKSQKIQAKASYIKDSGVRDRYLEQMTNTVGSRAQSGALKIFGLTGKEGRSDAEIIRDNLTKNRQKLADRYNSFKDEDKKREFLESQPDDIKEFLRSQQNTVFKDTVPANTAPVQNNTDLETGSSLARPLDTKATAKDMTGGDIDMSYVEMAEGKPYTQKPETEIAAPTYTPKGTVVPNGAITFNFNGVAHQSFTAAVKQAEKAKTATTPQSAPAENKQNTQPVAA